MSSDPTRTDPTNLIDRFSRTTGRVTAWLTLFMVLTTFVIVVMRYAFDVGLIWVQESVTWMHAMVFMIGAAYTLQCEDHVRVVKEDGRIVVRVWSGEEHVHVAVPIHMVSSVVNQLERACF